MTLENRYPSPEPGNGNQAHPYHNGQRLSPDVAQLQQHAPTAMMHQAAADAAQLPPGFQYVAQYGAPQPSTPQQLAQQGLDVDGGQQTDASAKKKSKVSRACDECRRKKVRCDADTEQGGPPCSNCKRTASDCQFSRQPQKRGPSKGYIKELAERVSRLEDQPGGPPPDAQFSPMGQPQQDADPRTYSPHMEFGVPNQRKRTHSVAESQQNYLSAQDQLRDYASRPAAPTPNEGRILPGNVGVPAALQILPAHTGSAVEGLSSAVLNGYYDHIHQSLPLLPESHSELQSILDRSTPDVRNAFIATLSVAVNAATTPALNSEINLAKDAWNATQRGPIKNSPPFDALLRLHSLIFLHIADEFCGPVSIRSSIWLGAAVILANSDPLRLYDSQHTGNARGGDLQGRLLRRAWLCLITLDRWHAAAMCTKTLIDDEVVLDASDHLILGSKAFHLLRISRALGRLTNTFLHHPLADIRNRSPLGSAIVQHMIGEVSSLGESLEPLFPHIPLLHAAYLHIKILADKAKDMATPSAAYYATADTRYANQIIQLHRPSAGLQASPFAHHFLSLAAATLALNLEINPQLCADIDQLRRMCGSESRASLPPPWSRTINTYIASQLDSQSRNNLGRRDGLQGLADAAVGADGNPRLGRIDWSPLLEKGYLNILE